MKGQADWAHRERSKDPQQIEHDVFFDAIRNNKALNDAEIGAKSTMTAIMGRMATYSGQMIEWDEALASNINLMPEKLAWDALPKSLPDANGLYKLPVPGQTEVV